MLHFSRPLHAIALLGLWTISTVTAQIPHPLLHDIAPPTNGGGFGGSVAVSGKYMVSGGGGVAYVYDLSSVTPTVPLFTLNNPGSAGDEFGNSVALSGTRVVVGAIYGDSGAPDNGSAYVYDLASATPSTPIASLHRPAPYEPGAYGFGYAVAISGTRVVVGAVDYADGQNGSAYVFDVSTASPSVPIATLTRAVGVGDTFYVTSVAISGVRVAVKGNDNAGGSVQIYDLSSATPTISVATLNGGSNGPSTDGHSIGISGTLVAVPSEFDSVFVYDLAGFAPTVPVATLENPGTLANSYINNSGAVAISGTRVVVNVVPSDALPSSEGAFVYELNSATPGIPVATLTKPGSPGAAWFGLSAAVSGNTVVVGAALGVGHAYVFGSVNPNDTDNDGLLDSWEGTAFFSLTSHSALDDSDGDGRVELLEYAFYTDPLVPDVTAGPQVVNEGGYLTITITKRSGVTYSVQSASTPRDTAFTAATTSVLLNDATTLKVRDNVLIGTPLSRFMRVKVTAAP